ncbi:MAG TPA: ABC transporter permease [Vicinamibacterales bacterium]|jgi:predicted permease
MAPDQRELDDEIRGHLALAVQERIERGEDPVAARRAALAELGYVGDVRDSMRRVWFGRWFEALESVRQDARFAVRVLRKSPGFSLVAVLTLALAIGANAVVFGVMNGLVLRPLDVPDPASLYGIEHANERSMYESYPDYRDLRDRNHSFEDLAGNEISQVGLDAGDRAVRAWVIDATGNYFDVLRLQPYLGRFFHASDEHGANSAPLIVLGYDYWHTHFNADPGVVGRAVRVNTFPFTIIGVAPRGFRGTLAIVNPDFYVPFVNLEQIEGRNPLETRAAQTLFSTFGHLKPGVTPAQAAADLNGVGAYLDRTYPNERGAISFVLARPNLYGNYLGRPMRAFLTGLMVLASLVLLAACANLGSLFAARASDRSREVAVRLSLGASAGRVLRQLLTEAVMISFAGGALGLWGSIELLRWLSAWQPAPRFPVAAPVAPDATVYAAAIALAVVSGLLFGIVPARQVFRTDPYQVIKTGAGHVAGKRISVRDLLLVAQVAICAVLVTASVVAVRGLLHAVDAPLGFDPSHVLLADTDLSMGRFTGDDVPAMQKRMVDALTAVPGVATVGVIGRPPLGAGGFLSYIFADEATDFRSTKALFGAHRFQVSPEYFEASQTRLLTGRRFTWHDDRHAPRVAVVNRELARRLAGSPEQAVGDWFRLRDTTRVQVVGVVEDGKYENIAEDLEPAVFFPLQQMPIGETWLLVRAAGQPDPLAPAVRATLRDLDAALPIYVESWNRQLEFALFPARMATLTLGVMGAIGVVLAITGVFGMAAYSVSRRLKELGIRIALGARHANVLGVALGRALKLLACGSAAGVVLGALASRLLTAIVYGATPRDPVVLGSVVAVMVLLGLAATWIPARRALSADPLTMLRHE